MALLDRLINIINELMALMALTNFALGSIAPVIFSQSLGFCGYFQWHNEVSFHAEVL